MAKKSFRDFLRNLEDAGEISRIKKIVDPREMSGLAAQNDKATIFEAIEAIPGGKPLQHSCLRADVLQLH